MLIMLSIGFTVSNSLTSSTSLPTDPITLLLEQGGCVQLCWQHQQLSQPTVAAITASVQPKLIWFGEMLSWQKLQAILSQLALTAEHIRLTLLTPDPRLPAGIAIQAEHFARPAQALLNELALLHHCQLVYQEVQPSLSQPGLLVMDMDSTAIQIECIDEIARLAGVGEQVAAITARAMNGELDFAQSLRERVAALAGAPVSVLQQVLQNIPLMPGLTELVSKLQQHGWHIAIASGGFTYFTEALQQRLNLDATFANQLAIANQQLTGTVVGDVVDAQRKAEVIKLLCERFKVVPSQTVAIGDGANDLPMLATAALGVAFHAKPKVQAAAQAAITQGSLLQLLYLLAAE